VLDTGTPSPAATQSIAVTAHKPTQPLLEFPSDSNGAISFLGSGDQGPDYVIERTHAASWANWLPLATNLSPALPFDWSDPESSNALPNFYRVRLAP
jgi:hypothetical protein